MIKEFAFSTISEDSKESVALVCRYNYLDMRWKTFSFEIGDLLQVLQSRLYDNSNSAFTVFWQCKMALKPDGLFLAAILGGETLKLFVTKFFYCILFFKR